VHAASCRKGIHPAGDFAALLAEHHINQSRSLPQQCWDDAVAGSWFTTLKLSLIDCHPRPTRGSGPTAVVEVIEVFYNCQRMHSSLNYMPPVEYEALLTEQQQAVQAASPFR